jgi:hypothetical protein
LHGQQALRRAEGANAIASRRTEPVRHRPFVVLLMKGQKLSRSHRPTRAM